MNKIKPEDLDQNVFKMLSKDWALVTAKKDDKVNTMTVSWGGMGVMWTKNVVFIVVRPQRYTKEFLDAGDSFSMSFLPEDYRKELAYLGKVSGRDEDKIAKSGLTVVYEDGVPYFKEGQTVLICKKMYSQPWTEEFVVDEEVKKCYPEKDYHVLYIAEIETVLA